MQTLATRSPRLRQATHRSWVLDVLLAIAVGFAAALAKRYLDWHLGIPGHAGIGWIAVLVSGALANPRRGMTALAGVSMAVWAVPLGLGHAFGYNAVLYGSSAAALEAAILFRLPVARWWGAAIGGAAVHLVKYSCIVMWAWFSGIVRNFEIYGLLAALRNHLVFGMAGGLVGWAVLATGRRILLRRRRPDQ
jgi:hypothetical protein